MKPIATAVYSLMGVAALLAGLSGCSANSAEPVGPTYMSVGDLQVNVAKRVAEAGGRPESVACDDGLVVGADSTTACNVVFGPGNAARAIVTATGADESEVTFDLAPAMSRQDVEKAVAGIAAAPSARCETGLDGKVGAATACDIATDPMLSMMNPRRIAEVAKVDIAQLRMKLNVFELMPKEQMQGLLAQRMFADGLFPKAVECAGDVPARAGSTVECVAVTGGQRQRYDVTVARAQDGFIAIDYKAKP